MKPEEETFANRFRHACAGNNIVPAAAIAYQPHPANNG
jgi:hypothetical protein